jgi:hypothetical protein
VPGSDYGEPMVRWGDQGEVCGLTTYFRGLVYADGTKIDYTIWPEALLDRIAEEPVLPDMLDVGYRVLLDKDGRASRWKPPAYRAHIPAKPTATEYRDLVEEFWWSMTYIAKSLWRDELASTGSSWSRTSGPARFGRCSTGGSRSTMTGH